MGRLLRSGRRVLPAVLSALLVAGLSPAPPAVAAAEPAVEPGVAAALAEQSAPGPEQSTSGRPVMLTDPDGALTLLIRGGDGMLWRRERDSDGRWGAWESTSRAMRGNPAVGRQLFPRPVVFVVGDDGRLWRQERSGGGWGSWVRMAALPNARRAQGTPAVVSHDSTLEFAKQHGRMENGDGRLVVFVRSGDGALWQSTQRAANGLNWTAWQRVGSGIAGNPTAAVSVDGTIALYARNAAGLVRHRYLRRTPTGSAWSRWATISGLGRGSGDIAVAANAHEEQGTLFQVFANDTQGGLWTVTQTRSGRLGSWHGVWSERQRLLQGLVTGPTVVTSPDGRLTVFALAGNDRRLRLRPQTAPVPPKATAPNLPRAYNGDWGAVQNWRGAGDPSLRTVNAVVTELGRIEVFAVDNEDAVRHLPQLAGGYTQRPEGWWRGWHDYNMVGHPCARAGTPDCLAIFSPTFGTVLGDARQWDVASAPFEPKAWLVWELRPSTNTGEEGTFSIVNKQTKQCLFVAPQDDAWLFGHDIIVRECDGEKGQRWLLEPVAADDGGSPEFRIINDNYGWCIAQFDPETYPLLKQRGLKPIRLSSVCDSTDREGFGNQWRLGMEEKNAPGMMDLAVEYVSSRCGTGKSSRCRFTVEQSETHRPSLGCLVRTPVYNRGDGKLTQSVTWTRLAGTEVSIGGGVNLGFDVKNVKLGAFLSSQYTWIKHEAEADNYQLEVPGGKFGWLELSAPRRWIQGYWDFTSWDDRTWRVPGENISFEHDASAVPVMQTSSYQPMLERCAPGSNPLAPEEP